MKKVYKLFVLALVVFSYSAKSQSINYNDVAVIVNLNDTTSQAIANYFMQARNIPTANRIEIDVPAQEQITVAEFNGLRQQVENYLTTNNLQNSINYLVTTKGVPLGISKDTTATYAGVPFGWFNASVDAELSLILGPYASAIGDSFAINNPYFNKKEHFSRSKHNVYLVTRLDGYTLKGILNMIDRSGPNLAVNRDSALFVLDQDVSWNNVAGGAYRPLNDVMVAANSKLTARGFNVLLNSDSVYITKQRNVLGYASWGSNDNYDHHYTTKARPRNHWAKGSLAETYVSTSGRTFDSLRVFGGQSRIADLLSEGATGVKCYVYEPFSFALANVDILFDRYTDTTVYPSYNLAEAFYMASVTSGWMDVVIGDPKTSLAISAQPASIARHNELQVRTYPNPAQDYFIVQWMGNNEAEIRLTDMSGKEILGQRSPFQSYGAHIDVSHLKSGIYLLKVTTKEGTSSGKIVVN